MTRLSLPTLVSAIFLGLLALPLPGASAATKEPQPELGRRFVVVPVSGKVFITKPRATRTTRLMKRKTIPMGTTVDATKGRVKLVGSVGGERRAKGEFRQGAFVATQEREKDALIDLRLAGGDFAACDEAQTAGRRSRRVRRLRGKATGRFRTRGNHSAATVRGTEWLTEDYCDSSTVETLEGEVEASAGPASFNLGNGDIFQATCDPTFGSADPLRYCLATLSNLGETPFAMGFGTYVHDGEYTICIDPPPPGDTSDAICRIVPLPEPPPGQTYRVSVLGCIPDGGAGTYTIGWIFQGELLGTLPVEILKPNSPGYGYCPVIYDPAAGGTG